MVQSNLSQRDKESEAKRMSRSRFIESRHIFDQMAPLHQQRLHSENGRSSHHILSGLLTYIIALKLYIPPDQKHVSVHYLRLSTCVDLRTRGLDFEGQLFFLKALNMPGSSRWTNKIKEIINGHYQSKSYILKRKRIMSIRERLNSTYRVYVSRWLSFDTQS